jgi:hypothetical protein
MEIQHLETLKETEEKARKQADEQVKQLQIVMNDTNEYVDRFAFSFH